MLPNDGGLYYAFTIVDKSATIDLNGKKIIRDFESKYGIFQTKGKAHLVLKDTSENKTGMVYVHTLSEGNLVKNGVGDSTDKCSIIIEGGIYEVKVMKKTGVGMIDSRIDADVSVDGVFNERGIWVKGGSFILGNVGKGGPNSNGSPWIFNTSGNGERNIVITGGSFNADVQNQYWVFEAEFTKDSALKYDEVSKTYTVVKAVCYVKIPISSYTGDDGKTYWWEYPFGCETFEEALTKVEWYESDDQKRAGVSNTIIMLEDCCVNDLKPDGKEFYLESEGVLYTLSGKDVPDGISFKAHGNSCTLHISSSQYSCEDGYCINANCGTFIPFTSEHRYDSSITCIDQECKDCRTEIPKSTNHDYEIIDNHKVCLMCGHTVPLTMSGGTEGITSPDNKTTQNSSNQLEVSDIVTGTMVVIAVAILGMIIFDVVRKP